MVKRFIILCDITSHLSDLDNKLQGKLIFNLLAAVNAFKATLRPFKSPLLQGILTHFPICSQRISQERHLVVGMKHALQIELLIEEFRNRLTISSEEKLHLNIIENPFLINPEEAPLHLQMKVMDLQALSVY